MTLDLKVAELKAEAETKSRELAEIQNEKAQLEAKIERYFYFFPTGRFQTGNRRRRSVLFSNPLTNVSFVKDAFILNCAFKIGLDVISMVFGKFKCHLRKFCVSIYYNFK